MNKMNYHFNLSDINMHQLQILKRGCCPAILKGSFYIEANICNIVTDVCGLFHLKTFLQENATAHERFESSTKPYKEMLGWLRRIVESTLLAEEYFVGKSSLSILLEDLYFETQKGCALLLLKPSEESFFESLCNVCDEIFTIYPQSNGDVIRNRLEQKNAKALLSMQDILRFLSSWECELNEGVNE